MVTMSEVPTLTGWESRRRARMRPSSGVWIIDDADPGQATLEAPRDLILSDEPATLPRARKVVDPDDEDVVTIPRTVRSAGTAPPPRLIPIDLAREPVTIPMARRPEEPILDEPIFDGDDEVATYEMRREDAFRESHIRELSRDDGDAIGTLSMESESMGSEEVFDLDSLLSDVDSFEPHVAPAASSWPARPRLLAQPVPVSVSPSSFPGRPFAAGVAPTSQTDRPEGPTVGARAVSVLVAVAVVSLVLLATAMIVTDKSGIEAFTELSSLLTMH